MAAYRGRVGRGVELHVAREPRQPLRVLRRKRAAVHLPAVQRLAPELKSLKCACQRQHGAKLHIVRCLAVTAVTHAITRSQCAPDAPAGLPDESLYFVLAARAIPDTDLLQTPAPNARTSSNAVSLAHSSCAKPRAAALRGAPAGAGAAAGAAAAPPGARPRSSSSCSSANVMFTPATANGYSHSARSPTRLCSSASNSAGAACAAAAGGFSQGSRLRFRACIQSGTSRQMPISSSCSTGVTCPPGVTSAAIERYHYCLCSLKVKNLQNGVRRNPTVHNASLPAPGTASAVTSQAVCVSGTAPPRSPLALVMQQLGMPCAPRLSHVQVVGQRGEAAAAEIAGRVVALPAHVAPARRARALPGRARERMGPQPLQRLLRGRGTTALR